MRDEALFIGDLAGEMKVAGELAEEGKDVFWPQTVPCGCIVASHLPDSEAGAPIVVFQTLKDKTKEWQHHTLMHLRNVKNLFQERKWNLEGEDSEKPDSVYLACQHLSSPQFSNGLICLPRTQPVRLGCLYCILASLSYLSAKIVAGGPSS